MAPRRPSNPAGRPLPLIMLGNRQDELVWWKEQAKAGGYDSWSGSEAPGMVTFAFWVAQQILDGKKVSKEVPMGILTIEQGDLDKYLGNDAGGRRRQRGIYASRSDQGDRSGEVTLAALEQCLRDGEAHDVVRLERRR